MEFKTVNFEKLSFNKPCAVFQCPCFPDAVKYCTGKHIQNLCYFFLNNNFYHFYDKTCQMKTVPDAY